MIRLSALKEKLSWAIVLSIVFYLAAAVIGLAILLPTKKESARLFGEVELLRRNEANLLRIVEDRPNLEKQTAAMEEQLRKLLTEIPSQYDLPEVLEVLRNGAAQAGVKIEDLSHVPVKSTAGAIGGIIPLTLDISGGERLFSYLAQLQRHLPSLQITEAAVGYQGEGRFYAAVSADLHVLLVEQARQSRWSRPQDVHTEPLQRRIAGYGLPFEVVGRYFTNQVKILGVINKGGQSSALVAKDGTQRWVTVGDRLGEATVQKIFADGIVLNLDGVLLNLTIGGRQDESA